MGEWIDCEVKKPGFPRKVLVAYESDSNGEPCLDVGAAYYFPDGTWRQGGFFFSMGKDIPYEIREYKIKVKYWKELPTPPPTK